MKLLFLVLFIGSPILLSAQDIPPKSALHVCTGIRHTSHCATEPVAIPQQQLARSNEVLNSRTGGIVIIDMIVGTDGLTHNIHVKQSLNPELDEKAVEQVKQWKFQPGKCKGVPVPVALSVMVEFHINKSKSAKH
ncbi:MAG TPA: energy transducer TonB [Terriglobales bacterium]|jgi:TonB family protein